MGVYGPHTQFKCLLEAMIFGTCKKNIIMYSQMRFQPYQSHSLTVTGLKGGKKSKYWVLILKICHILRLHIEYVSNTV